MTINFRNFVVAIQGNFDHLMGTLRQLGSAHNLLVRDVDDIVEMLEDERQETSGKAPNSADYLVGTAQAGLTGEIVAGTTPGGELGGTWGSPTVDATHSGSAHHAAVTEGAGIDVSGQVVSVDLSEIAAGGELGGNMDAPTVDATHSGSSHASLAHPDLSTHDGLGLATQAELDTLAGLVATDAELATHAGAADPHTGYVLESLVDAVGDLIVGSADNAVARLAKGSDGQVLTVDATETLDLKWATPSASGGGSKMFAAWLGA